MNHNFNIVAFGENVALLQCREEISLEMLEWLYSVDELLNSERKNYIRETVVTYNELAVVYNCLAYSFEEIKEVLEEIATRTKASSQQWEYREIRVPVCYDKRFALDNKKLEEETRLEFESIVALHAGKQYIVYMMGFLPGFLYLGELDEHLWCKRLSNPRKSVPKGSVGIAGKQTGIYPTESPGGWNLIGRTPIDLISIKGDRLSFFKPLDRITFFPISKKQFDDFDAAEYLNGIFLKYGI